jgi:cardiolipin synthase C
VAVRISTNSLASTDNLPAFSGYRNQREQLLAMGLQIFEYKPAPAVQQQLVQRLAAATRSAPVFALHAKTLVIDGKTLYIGTYNFDPRSQNLNTEVGVVIHDEALAREVEAATDDPDRQAGTAGQAQQGAHLPAAAAQAAAVSIDTRTAGIATSRPITVRA